ncbi:ROK family protein [Nonomuraea sp. NPDC049152]|uniref:ROK family protein n=1 Tax=Nonomuraea sp. NPDC049152 TaxID=3154350 RepID=UPI00340F98B7
MSRPRRETVRDVRRNNRSVILSTLFFAREASRFELARLTGLSPATVGNVVADLMGEGVVVEAGLKDSDGGRPQILLAINVAHGHLAGVDVGESRVRVELFDLGLRGLAKTEVPLRPGGEDPEEVARHIVHALDGLLELTGLEPGGLMGVGVGVPGTVSRQPASLVHAPTIGWKAVPLGAMLAGPRTPPFVIDNGAKMLGLAESWFGAGRGAEDLIMALVGTGIGASIISDGVTYRGSMGGAGEWGHTKVVRNGLACRCGGRGCLEAYAGPQAILRAAGRSVEGADERSAFAALLFDPAARPVLEEAVRHLGRGIGNLINLFNPERVLLGGWAGLLLGMEFLPQLREAAGEIALPYHFAHASIERGRLGAEAVSLGAAALVLDDFLSGGTRS